MLDDAATPAAVAPDRTNRIRDLNDRLRTKGQGGRIMMTPGIADLQPMQVARIFTAVAGFNTFSADNDPYGEHDFGSVQVAGQTIFFKIDCYDCSLTAHSPDPTDPAVTCRVMTIMLASEY